MSIADFLGFDPNANWMNPYQTSGPSGTDAAALAQQAFTDQAGKTKESGYAGMNEGDRNLRLAIDKLAAAGVDVSNVDWTKIPEALRNYLRGGGGTYGESLSDFQKQFTGLQQQQSQMTAQQALTGAGGPFAGLGAASTSANPSADLSQALAPLLQHIEQQNDIRGNQYQGLMDNYLKLNAQFMPPALHDYLQKVYVPSMMANQQQLNTATEAYQAQAPEYSNLMAQLQKAVATNQQLTAAQNKANAGGVSTSNFTVTPQGVQTK